MKNKTQTFYVPETEKAAYVAYMKSHKIRYRCLGSLDNPELKIKQVAFQVAASRRPLSWNIQKTSGA